MTLRDIGDEDSPVTPRARNGQDREEPPAPHHRMTPLAPFDEMRERLSDIEVKQTEIVTVQKTILSGQLDTQEQIGKLTVEVSETRREQEDNHKAIQVLGANVGRLLEAQRLAVIPMPPRSLSPVPGVRPRLDSREDLARELDGIERERIGRRVQTMTDLAIKGVIGAIAVAIVTFCLEELRHAHDVPVNQTPAKTLTHSGE